MDSEPATKSTNRDLAKLDEHEKMMIRRSWNELMRDVEKSALEIFQMIFERAPEAKELFPFMQSSPKKRTEALKFHSLRFMQALESIVRVLDSPSEIDPLLQNLGRIHAKVQGAKNFKPEYWIVFRECTLIQFRKVLKEIAMADKERRLSEGSINAQLDAIIELWRVLIDYIVNGMHQSYLENVESRVTRLKNTGSERTNTRSEIRRETLKKTASAGPTGAKLVSTGSELVFNFNTKEWKPPNKIEPVGY